MPTLFLVRHAPTALNSGPGREARIRGWLDIPLTPEGRASAVKTAERLRHADVGEVRTSDLRRSIETAEILVATLALPDKPVSVFGLRPWNLGKYQGQNAAAAQPMIEHYAQNADEVVPDGESFVQFTCRALSSLQMAMDRAEQDRQPVVVVTHFRNAKLAESWIDGGKSQIVLDTFFKDDVDPGAVWRIDCVTSGAAWTLDKHGPSAGG